MILKVMMECQKKNYIKKFLLLISDNLLLFFFGLLETCFTLRGKETFQNGHKIHFIFVPLHMLFGIHILGNLQLKPLHVEVHNAL
mmetsp:Transcript_13813/g.45429  ORF Transcript_13813/g.45429 Transcript_13813/m.45429 type:complete len:85 (+) Transcript_13813:479-733(+)